MVKSKQWVALAVVAALGVLAGGWFLLVSPKRSEAADLRTQAAAQEQTNSQLKTRLQVLRAQAAALPQQTASLADVATRIPYTAAEPDLLRALQDAADTAGVELVSVAPQAFAAVGTGTGSATAAPAATTPATTGARATGPAGSAGTLVAMPVTITVAGTYNATEAFVAALEDLPRAVRLTEVTLANGSSPTASGTVANIDDGKHLLTTLSASVYVAQGATALTIPAVPTAPTS